MRALIVWIGGGALLAAAAIDTLAVLARSVGARVRGAIELDQGAILVAGVVALLMSTLAGRHARVHILLDRLSPGPRRLLDKGSAVLGALFYLALLAAGVWIAVDLWSSHEVSELLGVPIAAWRAIANLGFLLVAASWLATGLTGRRRP